jgi:hypothetical protein
VCHELFILKLHQRYGFHAMAAVLIRHACVLIRHACVLIESTRTCGTRILPRCVLNQHVIFYCVSRVFKWCFANSLKLNPSKSMEVLIYRNHLLGPLMALFLGDDFIPYDFTAKNLGVTFSYDLNWG